MNQSENAFGRGDWRTDDTESLHFSEAVKHGQLTIITNVAREDGFAARENNAGKVVGDSSIGQIFQAVIGDNLKVRWHRRAAGFLRRKQNSGDTGHRFTGEADQDNIGQLLPSFGGPHFKSKSIQLGQLSTIIEGTS